VIDAGDLGHLAELGAPDHVIRWSFCPPLAQPVAASARAANGCFLGELVALAIRLVLGGHCFRNAPFPLLRNCCKRLSSGPAPLTTLQVAMRRLSNCRGSLSRRANLEPRCSCELADVQAIGRRKVSMLKLDGPVLGHVVRERIRLQSPSVRGHHGPQPA